VLENSAVWSSRTSRFYCQVKNVSFSLAWQGPGQVVCQLNKKSNCARLALEKFFPEGQAGI